MNKDLKDIIQELTDTFHEKTVEHYRHLHAHPELSFCEKETALYIESVLQNLSIPYRKHIGGFGILAWIEGQEKDSKTIALRADMDALPIIEANDIPFKSQKHGVMHACGHDAHTASLLTTAEIISTLKDKFKGTILLIFQPGEEKHPGGARLMLENNIFENHKPDLIIGQHVYVDYPVGKVGFADGVIMASADEIHIKIKGKGGHGALPHQLNDTILAACQVVVSLQQIVSRKSNPFLPAVLSFGRIFADGATNVIPDEVILAGTFRCMDEKQRHELKTKIKDTAIYTAKAYGCECEIEIYDGYPCTLNDTEVTKTMKEYAGEFLGKENVLDLPKRMTSEDFGFFSQKYSSTFYRFGIAGSQKVSGLHTSEFLIDEKSLKISVGLLSFLALRHCEGNL